MREASEDRQPADHVNRCRHAGRQGGEEEHREQREQHASPDDPRPPPAAVEDDAGQDHAECRQPRADALEGGHRFAPEEDRQDDRQATVRRDDRADDSEWPNPKRGEERQVRARSNHAEDRRQKQGKGIRWQADTLADRQQDRDDHARDLGNRHDMQAAEPAAGERRHHVGRAPAQRGDQSVVESERHRPSVGATRLPRRPVLSGGTTRPPIAGLRRADSGGTSGTLSHRSAPVRDCSRGDVAQLEEHRVRIAGVRGSSPLISTIARSRSDSRDPERADFTGSRCCIVAAWA